MTKTLLNIDGFTKEVDTEYIMQLAEGGRVFRYPFWLALSMHPMQYNTVVESLNDAIPIIEFQLSARSDRWNYWEGLL